jgi:hypothetical protein
VKRALIIALGTFFLATPPAAAMSPLARMEAIADARYPASPCHGRTVVMTVAPQRLDRMSPDFKRLHPIAAAQSSTCHVYVAFQRMHQQLLRFKCRVLMHEFGHLAGLGHSTNPHSVMYPITQDIPNNSLACWRAFPERTL